MRSGLFSGDAIVAAGRKQVFSRVAAARAAAAKAGRLRVSRGRASHASSPGGSTISVASDTVQASTSTEVNKVLVCITKFFGEVLLAKHVKNRDQHVTH